MDAPATFDPDRFKATTRDAWNEAAAGWNSQTPHIHAWLADATARMLDAAAIEPGARVLDVAAGTGDQTLEIARRVGPDGAVTATDLSAAVLQWTLANAQAAGFEHVSIKVADTEELGLSGARFDAAVCRLGLMFCPDVPRALGQVRDALRPGARFAALVFSQPQANPCIGILMSTVLRHAGLPPMDPFRPGSLLSLGRPGLLEGLFGQAGFGHVAAETLDAPFRLASTHDYLEFIRTSATPVRQILGGLDADAQAAAWADIEHNLDAFQTPQGWCGPNELLLVSGAR